jgi:hypothetical protein
VRTRAKAEPIKMDYAPTGIEQLLGHVLEKIGIDLRHMSPRRAVLVTTFYYSVGLMLLVSGSYYFVNHSDEAPGNLGGLICAALGAAYLVRMTLNVVAYAKTKRA